MAALGFLLSAMIGGGTAGSAGWRGLLFLGGAAWAALWELARHPPWRSSGGSRDLGLAECWAAPGRSRRFAVLLAVPTALAAGVAGVFEISHGAWMATTVLRVMRPEASATVTRSGRRIVGTSAGALIAAVLLGTERHELTAVVVLVVCLSAMQLVGPVRYGIYTFFLTLIALELGIGRPGRQLASRPGSGRPHPGRSARWPSRAASLYDRVSAARKGRA